MLDQVALWSDKVQNVIKSYFYLCTGTYCIIHYVILIHVLFCQALFEFQLILQRPNIQEEFESQFLQWCEAIVDYCRETHCNCTAIRSVVNDADLDEGTISQQVIQVLILCFMDFMGLIHKKLKIYVHLINVIGLCHKVLCESFIDRAVMLNIFASVYRVGTCFQK